MKERVKVEVGVEAEARWGEVENLEGGVLSLVEGEEVEVVCEGRGGYPAPAFLWDSHPPPMGGDEGKRMGRSGEEEKSEGKEVAERSVELELFNPDQGAIPLNTTSKVSQYFPYYDQIYAILTRAPLICCKFERECDRF